MNEYENALNNYKSKTCDDPIVYEAVVNLDALKTQNEKREFDFDKVTACVQSLLEFCSDHEYGIWDWHRDKQFDVKNGKSTKTINNELQWYVFVRFVKNGYNRNGEKL